MSTVELRQRVREQQAADKQQKLKYRGVSYIKSSCSKCASPTH